eukprot:SM000160S02536  [mRNA]  locus=s160:148373:150650:+ [translate_table: standard]
MATNSQHRMQYAQLETAQAVEAMHVLAAEPWQEATQCATQLREERAALAACQGQQLPDGGAGGGRSDCGALEGGDLALELAALRAEVVGLRAKNADLERAAAEVGAGAGTAEDRVLSAQAMDVAKRVVEECGKQQLGVAAAGPVNGQACKCEASAADMARYLNYTARAPCPDDWFFVQDLIFVKNCFALPKRRCLAATPRQIVEPVPFPRSLWDQSTLGDGAIRWDLHYCKTFACLNTRDAGDCRNCFNLSLESSRWRSYYRGAPKMADVIAMKNGTLRIGLDAGGGTGSFAARMASYNVTIMTTAMNIETVYGRYQGLPYMETIARRGLIPLHVPHKARLPFFDNTLDVIHSVNSIKYLTLPDFEELVFEWDRVLRPGGIMWFEMFYTPEPEMPLYITILELLQYRRLYWNLTPKPDEGERPGPHVYLNCVIEKPARVD